MDFAVSVVHAVADLTAATEFLCTNLGFQQKEIAQDAVIVENGAIAMRLVKDASILGNSLTLEYQTQDFAKTMIQLLGRHGVSLHRQNPEQSGVSRVEALLDAPYGFKILLVQEFNEDELGIIPPLPTSLIWDEDAESCIKRMLKLVPISFRQSARVRVTERAEMLAGEDASITVTLDKALQALAKTTPLFQRPVLISALQDEGIDISRYFEETVG